MRKLLTAGLMLLVTMTTCTNKNEKAMDSPSREKAKSESVQTRTDQPCEPVSSAVIDSILQVVQQTTVDQVKDDECAVLETSMGDIVVEFFPEKAPKHCRSFKRLAVSGYYDCTYFHRVLKGFVIQGGDILTRDENPDNDGTGGPGYTIPAEFNDTPHDLGILSMARSRDPNSAGSQFFICLSRERTKFLDGEYTVFGQVIEGLDVVKSIGEIDVNKNRMGEPSVPVEPVYVYRVYMINKSDI